MRKLSRPSIFSGEEITRGGEGRVRFFLLYLT